MNAQYLKNLTISGFTLAVLVLAIVGFANVVIAVTGNASGIYPNEHGDAVYIAGEACTINAPLELSVEEFYERAEFCAYKHSLWRQLNDVYPDTDNDTDHPEADSESTN